MPPTETHTSLSLFSTRSSDGCRSKRKSGKCNCVRHDPSLARAAIRRGMTTIQDVGRLGCFFLKKKKNVYLAALGLSCGMGDLVP